MINRSLLPLFLLFLLVSCIQNKQADILMNQAQELIELNPRKSHILLDSIQSPEELPNNQKARWCMLMSRTSNKLNKDLPYSDQLFDAWKWYKKYGTKAEEVEIGLYLGRAYVKDKSYVKATNAYSEALELALDSKDYNQAGYISSYLGDLYNFNSLKDGERTKYEEAAYYFKKAGNLRSHALALRDVSKTWAMQDSLDKALTIMKEAESILLELKDSVALSSISNGLGNIYTLKGDTDAAKESLFRALDLSLTGQAATCTAISQIYINTGDLDSARFYLEKAQTNTRNIYTPASILFRYSKIEKMRGNYEQALLYIEQFNSAKDSIYDSKSEVNIIEAEKRFNHLSLLNRNRELQISRYVYMLLAALTLIFALLIWIVFQIKDRKRLFKINEQRELLEQKENRLYLLNLELKNHLADNTEFIKQEIKLLHQEVKQLKEEKFKSLSPVKRIVKMSRKVEPDGKNKLQVKDWKLLIDSIAMIYQDAFRALNQNAFGLTVSELQICYLSFLELGINEEAILLNINPESVSRRRFRTRQKLYLVNTETSINNFLINDSSIAI